MLIVPQNGVLRIRTEFGKLTVVQKEIVVIPRGIKFKVEVDGQSSGWIAEIFKGHFRLPDLGPIGSNGLANPRDFEAPIAAFENIDGDFRLINKYCGEFFEAKGDHSVFDVVAWHGNFYPFKYNLEHFNAMNSVTFDHPDPSIFTVLTAQSDERGVAICDFVIFSPRWMVAEHTFRPPYYHRNTMSEFMGNVHGAYDAKGLGFGPGASSLHSTMTAHGPDGEAFEKASAADLKPVKYENTLSFMFETVYMVKIANPAFNDVVKIDEEYNMCWGNLKNYFKTEQ
jgi:homogentisate 1,2-dioxygenase